MEEYHDRFHKGHRPLILANYFSYCFPLSSVDEIIKRLDDFDAKNLLVFELRNDHLSTSFQDKQGKYYLISFYRASNIQDLLEIALTKITREEEQTDEDICELYVESDYDLKTFIDKLIEKSIFKWFWYDKSDNSILISEDPEEIPAEVIDLLKQAQYHFIED